MTELTYLQAGDYLLPETDYERAGNETAGQIRPAAAGLSEEAQANPLERLSR